MQTRKFHTHGLTRFFKGQIEISREEIEAVLRLRSQSPQEGDTALIQALISRVRQIIKFTTGREKVIFCWDCDLGITFDRGHCLHLEDGTTPPSWQERYQRPNRAFGIFIEMARPSSLGVPAPAQPAKE